MINGSVSKQIHIFKHLTSYQATSQNLERAIIILLRKYIDLIVAKE